ncbi:hypothetical protein P1X15_06100 [Runella sp. MFBS21]|uniref:hypothetical protein n=1 Tax=Runella sp. MFBS21 TaxID=3034018 RepID=UPI0023F71DD6|nr:hypothetical protein [Runella sp. MFBS21]MDF7817158.1 hypothetical protein [Runella sp. MFBS21]
MRRRRNTTGVPKYSSGRVRDLPIPKLRLGDFFGIASPTHNNYIQMRQRRNAISVPNCISGRVRVRDE